MRAIRSPSRRRSSVSNESPWRWEKNGDRQRQYDRRDRGQGAEVARHDHVVHHDFEQPDLRGLDGGQ
jgi:hypothetical protein